MNPILCTHTHWHVAQSIHTNQNLPKSMAAPTHGRRKSTGIQHCIRAIAGEVVKSRSVHFINFSGNGQVIVLKSATALILDRCAKVSAPLQLLHIEARITSAAESKRFRCRKNPQHICGLAKFPQESKLSEETSPIRASLAVRL